MLLAVLALAHGTASAATGPGWRRQAWPAHVPAIESAVAQARAVDGSRLEYPADFRVASALLERAAKPARLGAVEGTWQVRSLQVNRMGTFAYPWFRSRIVRGPAGLRFEKTTGSQRRSGVLLPHGDGRSLVFLGTATVNAEPQAPYSRVRPGGAPAAADSSGRLVRIGPRELLMVLDVDGAAGRYELYHLRR